MEGVGRSVIDDGDSRDRLVVPFRPGVHALPSCAGVVDESGFSDLPEEAIVAKSSSDPHTELGFKTGIPGLENFPGN